MCLPVKGWWCHFSGVQLYVHTYLLTALILMMMENKVSYLQISYLFMIVGMRYKIKIQFLCKNVADLLN
jgi:hypothetical protein